jgi:TolB protein
LNFSFGIFDLMLLLYDLLMVVKQDMRLKEFKTISNVSISFVVFCMILLCQMGTSFAQTEITARITKGAVKYLEAIDLAVIDFSPKESEYAPKITQVVQDDLKYSLYFRLAEIDSFVLAILRNDLYNLDGWRELGVQYLLEGSVKIEEDKLKAEINLMDVLRKKVILTKRYQTAPKSYRALAHAIADDMVLNLTGHKGIFSTKIAYVSINAGHKEIYICDYDGHNPYPVTKDKSINLSPVWSPDGDKLTYTSYKKGNPDLWMTDLKSSQAKTLSAQSGLNSAPAWSPDGKYLALTLTRDKNAEIYLISSEGEIIRRLTNSRSIDSSPTWSPSGKEVAFTSDRAGIPQIYVMDVEGANVRRLTYRRDWTDSPCWSPRGDKIAFVSRENWRFHIYTMDVTGENMTRLTYEGSNENPHWSPDGLHIVFSSNRSGEYEIYTMNWDGSNQKSITNGEGNYNPSWSPILGE